MFLEDGAKGIGAAGRSGAEEIAAAVEEDTAKGIGAVGEVEGCNGGDYHPADCQPENGSRVIGTTRGCGANDGPGVDSSTPPTGWEPLLPLNEPTVVTVPLPAGDLEDGAVAIRSPL